MEVKSLKDEHAAATRAAILESARELFAEHGYSAVSIERITQRTRVTRGALYHHFRDKADLFLAVFERLEDEIVEQVTAAILAERDPAQHLEAGSQAFLDVGLDSRVQRIVLIDGPAVLGFRQWHDIASKFAMALFREGLTAGMQAGHLERQPLEPLAHILFGALTEGALLIANAGDPRRARAEVGTTVTRLLAGLRS
jgi:AcrR family transcriptional regulator